MKSGSSSADEKTILTETASSLWRGSSKLLKKYIELITYIVHVMDILYIGRLVFVPRSDDVFIVTYPRSGTTWMQMILYQLTTDGGMDIDHINQFSPWFERSISLNIMSGHDLEAMPSPRVFKSHLPYNLTPIGASKKIYIVRNGKDVAVSFYHFYQSHLGFKGSFAEFHDRFMKGKVQYRSWFNHVAGWWEHKDDPNVLFLKFEDMVDDLEGVLKKIIEFCEFDITEERFTEILERCSFSYMKKYEDKFDHINGSIWEKKLKPNSFLRKGVCGGGEEFLTSAQKKLFDREYKKRLGKSGLDY